MAESLSIASATTATSYHAPPDNSTRLVDLAATGHLYSPELSSAIVPVRAKVGFPKRVDMHRTAPFWKALQNQKKNEQGRGRAAMINVTDEQEIQVWTGTPLEAIRKADDIKGQKLLIFEDLGRDWVQKLVQWWKIPDYVFALHWALPNDHVLGNARIPLGQDPSRHFILNYRQPLPFAINKPKTEQPIYLECTAKRTVVRRIRSLKDIEIEEVETVEQLVSYWRCDHNGEEIAILLVDPCPDIKAQFPLNPSTMADPRIPRPHPPLSETGPSSVKAGPEAAYKGSTQQSSEKDDQNYKTLSLFDELVNNYETYNAMTFPSMKPLSWTFYCRRLVLARAASVVQSALVETWRLTGKASTGVKEMATFDFAKLERNAWSDDWKGDFFTQLWELREDLELMRYRLDMNRKDLDRITKIEAAAYSKKTDERPSSSSGGGRDSLVGKRSVDDNHQKSAIIEQSARDMEEWGRLVEMNDYAFKLMNRTTETYVQAIGATATQFANAQAQNSRKLTGFAAIFVPASLAAAILAIPSFSPDAKSPKKFYAFWAVSVPLAIMLGLWFLSPIPEWFKARLMERKTRKDPARIKERANQAPSATEIFGGSSA